MSFKYGATTASAGYGIAKVVKAVPSASRPGWLSLSAVASATYLAPQALQGGYNSSRNSPGFSNTPFAPGSGGQGDSGSASSIMEFISDEQQLVFACIIFCGVALLMFVRILLNLAWLRFGDRILSRIADRPLLMRLYRCYSISSVAMIIIMSLIILYSLAFTFISYIVSTNYLYHYGATLWLLRDLFWVFLYSYPFSVESTLLNEKITFQKFLINSVVFSVGYKVNITH